MLPIWNRYIHSFLATRINAVIALLSLVVFVTFAQAQEQTQAQSPEIDIPGEGTVTQPQGAAYVVPQKRNAKLARVVVYRPAQGFAKGVAHVEVNGRHHTSLQLGGFSEICIEPSQFTLAANMVDADPAGNDGQKTSLSLRVRAAQDFYLRVNENGDNRADITPVSDKQALAELKQTRRQTHVATRLANLPECVEPEDAYAPREAQGATR